MFLRVPTLVKDSHCPTLFLDGVVPQLKGGIPLVKELVR